MADQQGWWTITFTPDGITPSDADLAHIGEMIAGGCTEGQILPDNEDRPQPDTHVPANGEGQQP